MQKQDIAEMVSGQKVIEAVNGGKREESVSKVNVNR